MYKESWCPILEPQAGMLIQRAYYRRCSPAQTQRRESLLLIGFSRYGVETLLAKLHLERENSPTSDLVELINSNRAHEPLLTCQLSKEELREFLHSPMQVQTTQVMLKLLGGQSKKWQLPLLVFVERNDGTAMLGQSVRAGKFLDQLSPNKILPTCC